MKVLVAAAMIATIVSAAADAAQPAGEEAKIRALEGQFAAAVNAEDINAIMRVYVPDETLFVFDVVPPRQYVGAKAYRKDWKDFLALFKGPLKFAITDLQIVAVGTEHVSVPVDLDTDKPDLASKP